jgi:hypothetical protein
MFIKWNQSWGINIEGFLIQIAYQLYSLLQNKCKCLLYHYIPQGYSIYSEISYLPLLKSPVMGPPNNPVPCPYFLTGYVVYCISFLKLSQCTNLIDCTSVHLPLYSYSFNTLTSSVTDTWILRIMLLCPHLLLLLLLLLLATGPSHDELP